MITTNETATNSNTKTAHPEAALNSLIESIITPLGYELVAIEVQNHREKSLRVFIDLLNKTEEHKGIDDTSDRQVGITVEDCVKVTHALDQPLEANPIVDAVISGAYDLEVSSPGVERPLRKSTDFDRFAGELARIHTYRPLTGDETKAPEYSSKNPKQKNFYGILRGYSAENQAIQFGIIPEDGNHMKSVGKKQKGKKASDKGPKETLIFIPTDLVSKAHLEPIWENE
ncbi:MAG: ribosome maturation factor RimP [Bdellovibrionales bacterium]|nr:ribosome maturation factor RimP [Bdellovibrionales bacterium]